MKSVEKTKSTTIKHNTFSEQFKTNLREQAYVKHHWGKQAKISELEEQFLIFFNDSKFGSI